MRAKRVGCLRALTFSSDLISYPAPYALFSAALERKLISTSISRGPFSDSII